jgi:RNA polymerase sigma factor (sigma-70 family)
MTKEEYDYIDSLVLRYQDGDPAAAEILLQQFQPYILKYLSLLTGNYGLKDSDIRKFVSTFIKDKEAQYLLRLGKAGQEQKAKAYEELNKIVKLCSFLEQNEILNELVIILLKLARRYKKGSKSFANYLYKSFCYELSRRIKEIIKDPSVYQRGRIISFYDLSYINKDSIIDTVDVLDRIDNLIEDGEDELNNAWIQGITCCDKSLARLKALDRLILKYYYIDGYTDEEIGQKLNYNRVTITRRRHFAVAVLLKGIDGNEEKDDRRKSTTSSREEDI